MSCEQLKLENQVCFRLYTAARLITKSYQPFLSRLGLTYTQYIVMMVLWAKDNIPVNDIARHVRLETNTLTPLIKRLEKDGIVVRSKGKDDGRQTIVSLTDKGRQMEKEAANVPACMVDLLKEVGVDEKSLGDLVPTLDNLIAKLEDINNE